MTYCPPTGYPADFVGAPPPVTLAGFTAWVYAVMGVPPAAAPAGSLALYYAYQTAAGTVNLALSSVPGLMYSQAVYNLGGDNLANWAPDVPGVDYPGTNTPYWTYLRTKYSIDSFAPGVVSSTSDEGTSTTLTVPDVLQQLQLDQLQNLKTPWGRRYLALAQKYGPNAWGIS